MKNLFPQFSHPSELNYSSVWRDAIFVFDTNVLLNLYRYQSATRDELLNVLSKLADRIWIPHHVALEFQRNRLKVIAEQNRRFADVRRTIEKAQSTLIADFEKLQLHRRHSLINPQLLINGFGKLADDFLVDLKKLQETQQKLSEADPLKIKIEDLFFNRVGPAPTTQSEIDVLYKEAEARYKSKIPPGYQDADKDKDGPDEHISGGIVYKRKYGDFLVWHQLLANASSKKTKAVVFVTDDRKEDWWWKIDSDGPKTIGPRPELIEEAKLKASVESLLMYDPEGFLKYAKEFLQASVSEATLKEVRDVSTQRDLMNFDFNEIKEVVWYAERAVLLWLERRFGQKIIEGLRKSYPDFVIEHDGKIFGFEVKVIRKRSLLNVFRIRDIIYQAYETLLVARFFEMAIVWVVETTAEIEVLKQLIAQVYFEDMPNSLRMIIGLIENSQSGDGEFCAYEDFSFNSVRG